MGVKENLQLALGRRKLKQQLSTFSRERYFRSFAEVKRIGVVFNATSNADVAVVRKYVKYLQELGKRVLAVGYYSLKEVPELVYSKVDYDFFSLKELTWNRTPSSPSIANFIDEPFDLLLDLNVYDDFPLHYITALSRARFKIGPEKKHADIHDLTLSIQEPQEIKVLLRNIDHYLNIIRPHD